MWAHHVPRMSVRRHRSLRLTCDPLNFHTLRRLCFGSSMKGETAELKRDWIPGRRVNR